jgi:hypothetical protein
MLIGGMSALLCIGVLLWWQINRNAELRATVEGQGETINATGEYNDATDPAGCGWHSWLLDDCPAD